MLFFLVPGLCFPLLMWAKRLFAPVAQAAGQKEAVTQAQGIASVDDKRGFPRGRIEGVIAHVSDGMRCCRGAIADISPSGVCLVSPKGSLDQNAETLGVLLTGSGATLHMRIRPRWNKDCGADLNIGASIEETLGNWDFISEPGEDRQLARAA